MPYNTTAEEALSYEPDGIMLSNGGGDPADNVEVIEQLKKSTKRPKINSVSFGPPHASG